MHLLATTSGTLDGAANAIDINQQPGDIVILTAADSEIAALAQAADTFPSEAPTLRLANLLLLQHNYSVDLYAEKTLAHAKLVVVRLLGGRNYWPHGVDVLQDLARDTGLQLALLPGGQDGDDGLKRDSTVKPEDWELLRLCFARGGLANTRNIIELCHGLIGQGKKTVAVESFPTCGTYLASQSNNAPHVAIIFYRSVIEGGQTAPIDALAARLKSAGNSVDAIYVASLKDSASRSFLAETFATRTPDIIVNATSFAVGDVAADPLATIGCPVLQISLAGISETDWRESTRGLAPRDLAMSVVLPELDGRIFAGVVSFKADHHWHARTCCRIVTYKPVDEQIDHAATLAMSWARLRHTAAADKRIAIVLANYPNKDGRIANGVGYDTPQSTVEILKALHASGYSVGNMPHNGNHLIETLQKGVTNAHGSSDHGLVLPAADYNAHFSGLHADVQSAVVSQWGAPEDDPFFRDGAFHLPLQQFGNVVVGIQPARGYNIDPKTTYHDPALVPPHGYFAFYFWLRSTFAAHAVIHNGKHGNLEWLPGKAVGLSASCYPTAVLGPLPNIYPFIVNDPGEGTAAKRRNAAVIIDHLTPPLTRAETYGPLKDLEALVDEYYLASGLDTRRLNILRENILELTRHHQLDRDAGFTGNADSDLQKLDTFLCDLKEAQIRDGLHILGQSPTGRQETDLLVALTRLPRGTGEDGDQSLIRALAADLALTDFDPLACAMAETWTGSRPQALAEISDTPWRTSGDTVERLELLATQVVEGRKPVGIASKRVIEQLQTHIRPALQACGPREMQNLLAALDGRRVPPGRSGAPTRGRLDVLPTGKNFFSIDNRTLPTPAAWNLGRRSADELLKRYFQDHGQHLKTVGLSAWGTANMRTGGDDIAQAMWLLGVKPVWDNGSWRVSGFEVQPLAALGRPRVDVTLRISGFFRDAFPAQIELLDKAIRAVSVLDEPESENPLAARTRLESQRLQADGLSQSDAMIIASHRIFGAKPGAYGAGLQALIDEGIWDRKADLAAAYVTWGAYAYGAGIEGAPSAEAFKRRLTNIEAVLHNQDNREHDLLDSDDYYQFEGGMHAAVEGASGRKPTSYHNDHSRPERPVIRTLEEEVSRVMRSRVVNPKWIEGVKRHGYKGAFEIAATVDYMFAFAATTGAVKTHHFDIAYDAFLGSAETLAFMRANNPAALREMSARFAEAITRGLWQPRLNSVHAKLEDLTHD